MKTPCQVEPRAISVPNGCLSVAAVCNWTSLGRTKIYEEIASGRLKKLKCGARTFIHSDDLKAWLIECQKATAA